MVTARIGAEVVVFDGSEWHGRAGLIQVLSALREMAREDVPASDPHPPSGLVCAVLRLLGHGAIETITDDVPEVASRTKAGRRMVVY